MKQESFGQFFCRALCLHLKASWWPYIGPYAGKSNAGPPGNHAIIVSLAGALTGIMFKLGEVLAEFGFVIIPWWAANALAGILLVWAVIATYVTCLIIWYTSRNIIIELGEKREYEEKQNEW